MKRPYESPIPDTFYAPEVIPPPGQFVAVRDWLWTLEKPRWSIWRIRLAVDLVAQLQAKGAARTWFKGRAVCTAGAGLAALEHEPSRPAWVVKFAVQRPADQWQWKARGWGCYGPDAPHERLWDVRARVLTAFQERWFDAMTLGLLLQPACLACGKRLTDPLSMARLIGPECAGTARQAGIILWNIAEHDDAHTNAQKGVDNLMGSPYLSMCPRIW